jgi:hypothetical protein
LTDGQVGGFRFSLKERRKAKRAVWQKLKHYAEKIGEKAAERVGERLGEAVVDVAKWVALMELAKALKWFS